MRIRCFVLLILQDFIGEEREAEEEGEGEINFCYSVPHTHTQNTLKSKIYLKFYEMK